MPINLVQNDAQVFMSIKLRELNPEIIGKIYLEPNYSYMLI